MKNVNNFTNILIGVSATCVLSFAVIAFVLVPKAKAETSPDILTGRDLSVGSTGQDVTVLQGLMSETGYLSVPQGVPYGYLWSVNPKRGLKLSVFSWYLTVCRIFWTDNQDRNE